MDKIIWLAPVLSVVALLFAAYKAWYVSKAPAGNSRMQEIAAATSKVMRDGHMVVIPSEQLVPGDIVLLEAGDAVPADARILENVIRNTSIYLNIQRKHPCKV